MENKQATVFEMLVGLNVIDDENYQQYRKNMTPILHSYGGKFGYDFKVSEMLMSETSNVINRVFTIQFSDKEKMEAFFLDTDYKSVKEKYFEKSVESTTIISGYTKKI